MTELTSGLREKQSRKTKGNWVQVSQTLDTCRGKCRKLRHNLKRSQSEKANLFCLQPVAAVSVRTGLWQAHCIVLWCEMRGNKSRFKNTRDLDLGIDLPVLTCLLTVSASSVKTRGTGGQARKRRKKGFGT